MKSFSRISTPLLSMLLSKPSFHFMPQEESLVVLSILVMVLLIPFQSMRVTRFHMLFKESILLVEILPNILLTFLERLVQLSPPLLNSKSLETSKRSIAILPWIIKKNYKSMRTTLQKKFNMSSQMVTSLPLATNNSELQKYCLILLVTLVKKWMESMNLLLNPS